MINFKKYISKGFHRKFVFKVSSSSVMGGNLFHRTCSFLALNKNQVNGTS